MVFRSRAWWLLIACVFVVCPRRGQTQDIDQVLDRAAVAQSSGNYTDAAKLYARATTLSPATPELWSNRGLMEYLAGQMDNSAASFRHALKLKPGLFMPLLFLGKVYVQTGKPAFALPSLNQAHALRPDDPEVLGALGKASADLGHPRQARLYYSSAVRVAPQNSGNWFGLGVASLRIIADDGRELATSQSQSVWARALYADELLAQGRPKEATETYNAVLATASPAQTAILAHNLEDLASLPSNSQEAVRGLKERLKDVATPPCEPAACAYWSGSYEESTAQAERSAPSPEALYWSIKANERIAVNALSRFEELAPHSTASYDMVGDLYRHQRENDSALGEYRKALAIDGHDPGALMGAVLANMAVGQLDDAETMDQAALGDRPLDAQLNLLMAEILAAKNQLEQIKPYLAKTLSAPSELQPRVHLLLGRVAAQDGNTPEAIHQFELALPGDQDGSTHYQLSRLYRKTGNLVQAEKTEEEAKVLIKHRYTNAMIAVREVTPANP